MTASQLDSSRHSDHFEERPSYSRGRDRGASTAHSRAVAVVTLLAGGCGLVLAGILLAVTPSWLDWLIGALVALFMGLIMWYGPTPFTLPQRGARPASLLDEPRTHNLLEALCTTSGISKPQLMVYDKEILGAGSFGRNHKHAVIVISTKMTAAMSLVELEGVLAHELAHIKRGDNSLNAISAAIYAPLCWISSKLAWKVFAGLQRVDREIAADLAGVAITRYPPALCSVLEKVGAMNDGFTRLMEMPTNNAWSILWCWMQESGLELRLAVLREL